MDACKLSPLGHSSLCSTYQLQQPKGLEEYSNHPSIIEANNLYMLVPAFGSSDKAQ